VCDSNNLTSLPELPKKKLIRLDCYLNDIKCLPELPDTLQYLWTSPDIKAINIPYHLKEFKTWKGGVLTDRQLHDYIEGM